MDAWRGREWGRVGHRTARGRPFTPGAGARPLECECDDVTLLELHNLDPQAS